jgi:hypothetical protein
VHKEGNEQDENDVEELMDIDEDELIIKKLVLQKHILEEQARELQKEQVQLENKYHKIQEELEELSYLI